MSAVVGTNLVRYFFYPGARIKPDRRAALVSLAYQAVRQQIVAPHKVLIRSDLHDTTSVNGVHEKDPKGFHLTLSFKDEDQDDEDLHITVHGYTKGKNDFELVEATSTPEKKDATAKGKGKVVWPSNEHDLVEWTDSPIGYSHIDESK